MKSLVLGIGLSALFAHGAFAADATAETPLIAPQPTACIVGAFSSTGSNDWKDIVLKLKNNCGRPVDFQNAVINFSNGISLNNNLWGDFAPLSYPDNNLQLSSQKQTDGTYLAGFNLHFPSYPGAVSVLPAGKSINIRYGAPTESHIGNIRVYLGTPVATGTIALANVTAKPANVSQTYGLVHITLNGTKVSDVQLAWNGTQSVLGLAPGVYAISADNVTDSSGNSYQGSATPAAVTLAANQIVSSTIAYTQVPQAGKIAIKVQALPTQLSGYTGKPSATLTVGSSGSSVTQVLAWNATTTVMSLINGSTYHLTTANISYNGFLCTPTFTPLSVIANGATVPTSNLTYSCMQTAQNTVTTNVTGAPSTLSTFHVTLTPNNGTTAVSQVIILSNGSGSTAAQLPNGVIYTVSSDAVSGYNISYNPQPLASVANAVENITLSQATTGTPVSVNGQLKVCGAQLCNQNGQPIQLKGMSSHGLQWYGWNVCLTKGSLDALATNFNSSIVRLSLYVQEGGYETDPVGFTSQMNLLINEVSKRGMYALVDWHILTPGDPTYNLARAKKFFTDVATANKGKVNLIYEIANEPNGVTWSVIKAYAEQIIPVIRAIDPNAVIVVGTPGWSSLGLSDGSSSKEIIANPVKYANVMYTFHFYAVSHRDDYLNELDTASNTLPIFVSEWGSQNYDGEGANDLVMSEKYIQLMAKKKISWANWNFSDDYRSGAIWNVGTCASGQWTDNNLKEAGVYVKARIKN
jgi:endoglucanase